ncbi:MAG: alpha-N-acetylglucosaminidase TIM-barrel domain-containing protein, partial [Verrucomicrobiota bacterium]
MTTAAQFWAWVVVIGIGIAMSAESCAVAGAQAAPEPTGAARQLLQRILPAQADSFILQTIPADQGRDVFEIQSRNGRIVLRGNNGIALASALNWYLKYYCHCHFSLKARQLALPEPLPAVEPAVRRVSQDRWRYFLNYCCFGYSLPWYDWGQWEALIDWMALNGVNAPLSVTGQEAVWRAAGKRLGFTESDLREFLPGPPYLPFGWMGCLDGWGGPLPKSWMDRHAALEKKILARERALGMTPVLQGFTGHVPPAARKRFPAARLHTVHWAEWDTL